MSSFGSESNSDVESLEEDVIDAQMKAKWKEWDERRKKVTHCFLINLPEFDLGGKSCVFQFYIDNL